MSSLYKYIPIALFVAACVTVYGQKNADECDHNKDSVLSECEVKILSAFLRASMMLITYSIKDSRFCPHRKFLKRMFFLNY